MSAANIPTLSLAGSWRLALDRENVGIAEKWFERTLVDKIELPGALQNQGFGDDVSIDTKWTGRIVSRAWFEAPKYAPYRQSGGVKIPFWLQPRKHFVGTAWYQREIEIPTDWIGRRVTLTLERAHWGTTVWLDGHRIGTENSLATPHRFELPDGISAGRHRLTLRIDNRVLVPVGEDAHSVTDHTQGNWNGVIGEIKLSATPLAWIQDLQIYPHVATRSATVKGRIASRTSESREYEVAIVVMQRAGAESANTRGEAVATRSLRVRGSGQSRDFETTISLGPDAKLWDEFDPALYTLRARLEGTDSEPITFGLREFRSEGRQFVLNRRPIMLRGTLECAIFPKTGYPPTDVESWRRIYQICRSHGLNHMRFHAWCPPHAAFDAADLEGFYLQVECGVWGLPGDIPMLDDFIIAEGDRILREYGNHPSFMMLCHGNEPQSKNKRSFLAKLVERWKAADSRRLYTSGAHHPIIPESDFDVAGYVEGFHLRYHGVIDRQPPGTLRNYSDQLASRASPVVAHEPGQWCAFPNLGEIAKYDGFMRSGALEITRDVMVRNGLIDRAQSFLMASGRFQTLLYKEEIEAFLRTPGLGGFQLLDLHDFPGQGTALVGVLDPFWESKGYVTAEEYRSFCGPTVPLAEMAKRVWLNTEEFGAEAAVAHFGPKLLVAAGARWTISDAEGTRVMEGEFPARDIATGGNTPLGRVAMPLGRFERAQKLVLNIALAGTIGSNTWEFWVYPAKDDRLAPETIRIAEEFNAETARILEHGGRVLLLPKKAMIRGDAIGTFAPIFWNKAWFPKQPEHTLGLLCDPTHPALRNFPTDFHSNWQWWDLLNHSKPMILDGLPVGLRPIVEPIDDWNQCRRLGLIFEVRVGRGQLLVCSIDLESDLDQRPVARQLRRSLIDYVAGPEFKPTTRLQVADMRVLIAQPIAAQKDRSDRPDR